MLQKETIFILFPNSNIIVLKQIFVNKTYPKFLDFGDYLVKLDGCTAKGTAKYIVV
jgi:hypothetical protein